MCHDCLHGFAVKSLISPMGSMHSVHYRLSVRWLQETKIVNLTPRMTSAELAARERRYGESPENTAAGCRKCRLPPRRLVPLHALYKHHGSEAESAKPTAFFLHACMQKLRLITLKRDFKCIQAEVGNG